MRISDWSSDVCSSDRAGGAADREQVETDRRDDAAHLDRDGEKDAEMDWVDAERVRDGEEDRHGQHQDGDAVQEHRQQRSEERSVGKEGVRTLRYRWSPAH